MAKRKNYTFDEYHALQREVWYSVPEIAARWHKPPAEVCRILEECGAEPTRFEYGGWVYWQFTAHAVCCAKKGQRVLFS